MIIIDLILLTLFLLNYIAFWTVLIKNSDKKSKMQDDYKKIFPFIWIICINTIPFINSSFLEPYFSENVSYLREYWIWFLMLGVVFLAVGFKIYSLIKKNLKSEQEDENNHKLATGGVYRIVRHPDYLAWLLIFIGSAFILDSFISLILIPVITILIEVNGFLKEKYVLVPKYGEVYENYKEKTPYRVISPPYNSLLFIIAILVIYIGFLNFVL